MQCIISLFFPSMPPSAADLRPAHSVGTRSRPCCAPRPCRKPAELSQSFIIAALQDLEPSNIHGKYQTPCQYAVSKARSVGAKHFSIVVTAYWSGDSKSVANYALKDVSNEWSSGVGYPQPTVAMLQRWKTNLQVRAAVVGAERGSSRVLHAHWGGRALHACACDAIALAPQGSSSPAYHCCLQ